VLLPSGQFLYAGNNGAGTVSAYSVNSTTGALTPGNVVQVGNRTFLQIDSSGQHLLIVGESLNSIFVDKIDPTSGAITQGNMTALSHNGRHSLHCTRFAAITFNSDLRRPFSARGFTPASPRLPQATSATWIKNVD
jgi:hypothetical protein